MTKTVIWPLMVNLEKIRNYHAEGGMVKFDNAD
jgi:hypothetical protein